ncbi:MAG: ribosome biogenesis GTPase YlqF [Clostridia bacterium]
MFIHWFPGHMTKAIRMMQKEMSIVDSIIYVLDARAPFSCVNPAFDEIIGQKPILYVLNKADLVPKNELFKWQNYINNNHSKCITTNSTMKGGTKIFIKSLLEVNKEKLDRYAAKGVKKTIRAMVIGVPNCGKSTLINSLIGINRTVTGDKPGVTRGKQWVSIDKYIDLLDTPGTLYPDFSDQQKATNLALIGSINEEVVDTNEMASEILSFLFENYPDKLFEKYPITEISEKPLENLAIVAKRRGYILRGGEYDYERAAKAVVLDFRKQAFGKVILEKINNDDK